MQTLDVGPGRPMTVYRVSRPPKTWSRLSMLVLLANMDSLQSRHIDESMQYRDIIDDVLDSLALIDGTIVVRPIIRS